MSSWRTGKLDLKCSISILQKALQKILPEWKDKIKVDPSGNLKMKVGSRDAKEGYHVIIQGGYDNQNDKIVFRNDVGLRKVGDVWQFKFLGWGISRIEGKLKQEVANLKVKQKVMDIGGTITEEVDVKGRKRIRVVVPVKEEYMIHA